MIRNYNTIYILTPNGLETGGAEALFQLANAINLLKGNAYSIFYPNSKDKILESYKKYKIKRTDKISDSDKNLLIVPEIWTEYLDKFSKINKAIWWLSVDNNFKKFKDFKNPEILHLYQSDYACSYLKEMGCKNISPLFDYLNDGFFSHPFDTFKKEDIVCYNPKKGMETTKKIMCLLPDVSFVPIENMTPNGVINLLKKSKLYIDFGKHPGKDRIPREANICYNCIITSKTGAAKNILDIPVSDDYKFDENHITEIAEKIKLILINYDALKHDFDGYRKQIWNQKEQFYKQVRALF